MDAKKLKTLAAAMRDAKVLHLKTPDVEVVLHPSAFLVLPDATPLAPAPDKPLEEAVTLGGYPKDDPLFDSVS